MTVVDATGPAPPTHRLAVGDYRKPLEEVTPGFPAFLGASEPQVAPPPGGASSGRRAALAEWLCRPDHPLTSRVMVNRIWQHHFGRGIVATPNDFGAMGQPPSHPELLDWLAVEFVESGYSIKAMHRLMVTSATYRQSSRVDLDSPLHAKALERDSGNQLLWHARRRRLEGEAIRDVMLELAGRFNPRMFGASAQPELPAGIAVKTAWEPDAESAGSKSPLDLRDRQAQSALSAIGRIRSARHAQQLPRAAAHDHRAAGPGPDERRIHARTSASLERAAIGRAPARRDRAGPRRSGRGLWACGNRGRGHRRAADSSTGKPPRSKPPAKPASTLPQPPVDGLDPARAAAIVDFCHALLNSNELLYID